MIRCPKCGTMNRDNNHLCKGCGTRLPQTSILCPECGAGNPVGNILCDLCNARLVTATEGLPPTIKADDEASSGVKGISLPTLPAVSGGMLEPAELPDWLAELTQETFDEANASSASEDPDWLSALMPAPHEGSEDAEEEALAPAELPDWFSDLVEAEPEATSAIDADAGLIADELPDWFSGVAEDVPEKTEGDELMVSELPDWFAGFVEEPAAEAPTTKEVTDVEAAPAEGLPDWFSGLVQDEPEPEETDVFATETQAEEPAVAEEFDWLSNLSDAALEPAEEQQVDMSAELPDWLSGLPEGETEVADTAPEVAAELPDWLRGVDDETSRRNGQDVRSLPSWLTPDTESDVSDEVEPPQELPTWLTAVEDVSPPAPPTNVEPEPSLQRAVLEFDALTEQPSEPEPVEEEEPIWLSDILMEESTSAQPETPVEQEELPDWLSGLTLSDTEFASEAPRPEPEPVKAPDWLSNVFTEEATVSASQPETPRTEAELPDWLSGILSEEPASSLPKEKPFEMGAVDTALPDWLTGIVDEAPAFEKTPGAETAPAMEGLPDWLAGLDESTGGVPDGDETDTFADVVADGLEGQSVSPVVKTVPDWLQDLPEAPDITAPKPAAPAFISDDDQAKYETDDEAFLFAEDAMPQPAVPEQALEKAAVPEWLDGLAPVTEEKLSFDESLAGEAENLARAEVPTWLQGFRPPGTGPLPPLPETVAADGEARVEKEGLVRAEIPDWVQQLRPEPSAEGAVSVGRDLLPVSLEDEGPLAGLVGVLPATMIVDMPLDFTGASRPEIPESIVAQAQLWQQLLEQPRSIERPVAQQRARSGAGERMSRLLVSVLLIAVTVFGLLADEPQLSQALSQPHVEALSRTIDTLQPGDVVVVAVEYGPAEAGEMSAIAEALLEHLAEKQVQVITVSTLPEGVGLAQGLLLKDELSNQVAEGQSAYLPGAANGVAMFLGKELEDVDLLVVLSARAERLRWWVELNNASRSMKGVSAEPLPMGIGASASVGPMTSPYMAYPYVKGWLVGFPDVVSYREFRGVTGDFFNRRLDALLLTHWAALALLIFGLCYYLAAGKKGNT